MFWHGDCSPRYSSHDNWELPGQHLQYFQTCQRDTNIDIWTRVNLICAFSKVTARLPAACLSNCNSLCKLGRSWRNIHNNLIWCVVLHNVIFSSGSHVIHKLIHNRFSELMIVLTLIEKKPVKYNGMMTCHVQKFFTNEGIVMYQHHIQISTQTDLSCIFWQF